MHKLGSVILCGGKSQRMGEDKASLPFGSGTLLDRAIENAKSLQPLNDAGPAPVVCVAAPHQVLLPLPSGVQTCRDESPGLGPLEALRVGLGALKSEAEFAFAAGCDTPFADRRLAEFLLARLENANAVVLKSDDHLLPLPGIYRCDVAAVAEQLIKSGKRSLQGFAREIKATVVPVAQLLAIDPELAMLQNCNTPDDYRAALSMLQESSKP